MNLYDGCLKCKKKDCIKNCNAGTKKQVTAKIDVEYQHNGNQDDQLQAFTEDLTKIMEKPLDEIENAEAYEEEFCFICPVKIKFRIDTIEGKKKMAECQVIHRWHPNDVA